MSWGNVQMVMIVVCVLCVCKCVTGALYRCLFGADDKLTPRVEYRPQRSYNRSAIETTRTSSIACIFPKT